MAANLLEDPGRPGTDLTSDPCPGWRWPCATKPASPKPVDLWAAGAAVVVAGERKWVGGSGVVPGEQGDSGSPLFFYSVIVDFILQNFRDRSPEDIGEAGGLSSS